MRSEYLHPGNQEKKQPGRSISAKIQMLNHDGNNFLTFTRMGNGKHESESVLTSGKVVVAITYKRVNILDLLLFVFVAIQLIPIMCNNLNSWLNARPAGDYLRKGSNEIGYGGTSCVEVP
jgi:hypothetical protein